MNNWLLRGHLLSKLSQLKQEAYQAGKKRNWDLAVSIYEQILDVDKNNPMVINEMGDLCLKAGETSRAVRHFLGAASRYRTTGLLNNAVAIYKKILRYDADNQSAHWYLAETRASQGLLVEGEEHAIRFLENSERVSGDIKEIFLKRCGKLFELYVTSKPILEKLLLIFRMWEMPLESARTECLLTCFQWEAGEEDEARTAMAEIAAKAPEILNYPEYQRLSAKIDPDASFRSATSCDVNSISFEAEDDSPQVEVPITPDPVADMETPAPEPEPEPFATVEPEFEAIADPVVGPEADNTPDPILGDDSPNEDEPLSTDPSADETSFAQVSAGSKECDPSDELVEKDETGCFDLGMDDETPSFEDLVAEAASGLTSNEDPDEEVFDPEFDQEVDESGPDDSDSEGCSVDLLAQILAEDDGSLIRDESSQLEAITEDIGAQVGGAEGEQDPASLYEMGLVYLDMGMFDQASDSFKKAGEDPDYSIRSCEMMGIALLKAQRPEDAIEVLNQGLEATEQGSKENLGLKYHLAQAYEEAERHDEAITLYQAIQAEEPHFLDVKHRLAALSKV